MIWNINFENVARDVCYIENKGVLIMHCTNNHPFHYVIDELNNNDRESQTYTHSNKSGIQRVVDWGPYCGCCFQSVKTVRGCLR
jgi:hypothetical protein